MKIQIPQIIRAALKIIHPQTRIQPVPTRQTEFDFETPSANYPETARHHKVHLNLAEKDSSRLLGILESAFAMEPRELTIELIGPGILLHDHALMLFEEIRNRPALTHLHVRARTCLIDGAILIWLAGDTRSMRCDGWIQLSALPDACSAPPERGNGALLVSDDEEPSVTDLRSVCRHMEEWLPVVEIAGRRLFEVELREFGLLDDEESRRKLAALFHPQPASTNSPDSASQLPLHGLRR
ncbi:MAG: hypothetical protein WCG66_03270 [bacterium]